MFEFGSNLPGPVTIQTPAKINFFLSIQRKRNDGYHDLLMDLIPVTLFDTISFQPIQDGGVHLDSNFNVISQEQNLIVQAVRSLEKLIQKQLSLRIVLKKNIPSGAGLGGGSGNAAGTLVTLNHIYKLGLSNNVLEKLALALGADVPFFINPQPSMAEGIGNVLSPIEDMEPVSLILIYPNLSISTAEAYTNCSTSERKNRLENYSFSNLKKISVERNDFWGILSEQYPVLKECRLKLLEVEAEAVGFSGSGSTLFGIFPDSKKRNQAFALLRDNTNWSIFCCETINHYQYISLL